MKKNETVVRINKTKSWFFEKMNKIDIASSGPGADFRKVRDREGVECPVAERAPKRDHTQPVCESETNLSPHA